MSQGQVKAYPALLARISLSVPDRAGSKGWQ